MVNLLPMSTWPLMPVPESISVPPTTSMVYSPRVDSTTSGLAGTE